MSENPLTSAASHDPALLAGDTVRGTEASETVGQVLDYFHREFDLQLDNTGNFTAEPTTEQLSQLKNWHEQTTEDGIIMPDPGTFTAKLVLARALMPQRDEHGNIQYLFGKGAGAELALQGDVEGRAKRVAQVPYRTHSDFEIYGAFKDTYAVIPHGHRFTAVFGGQEIYPFTRTKGLHDLPPNYLHQTAEVVTYGGLDFLVPRLELQFVDKFEKTNEPVERHLRQKTDAEWLAAAYALDSELVHAVLDNFVILPETGRLKAPQDEAAAIIPVLNRKAEAAKKIFHLEYPESSEAETMAAIGSDKFLNNYAANKGVEHIADLIDLTTGRLVAGAVAAIAASVRAKQERTAATLMAKHEQIDSILQAV